GTLRIVERPLVQGTRRAHQLGAADVHQHAIERDGVLFLLPDRTARNALAIASAIDFEAGVVGDADARRQPQPFAFRICQNILSLSSDIKETRNGGLVLCCPTSIERIAEHYNRPGCTETFFYRLHVDAAFKALAFELCTEIPECERGVIL